MKEKQYLEICYSQVKIDNSVVFGCEQQIF
jgi:hypothetical protein